MRELLLRGHLGLGDHLITNGLVRVLVSQGEAITLICKYHNADTLNFMFRDISTCVELFPVADDKEADDCCQFCQEEGHRVMKMGYFNPKPIDLSRWDQEMYRQAGVDFSHRWNSFGCHRQPDRELPVPEKDYIFVHDDPERGFKIDPKKLPQDIDVVRPEKGRTTNLFDWWGIMEKAKEIHCIDSCFSVLTDSLHGFEAWKFVAHLYARPDAKPPSKWAKEWQWLR